jgi:hypothetical protein
VTRAPASFGMAQFRRHISIAFALKEENKCPDQKQTEFTLILNNGPKLYFLPIGKLFSVHAMKIYKVIRAYFHSFLTLTIGGAGWSDSRHGRFPSEGGSLCRSGHLGVKNNLSPLPEINQQFLCRAAFSLFPVPETAIRALRDCLMIVHLWHNCDALLGILNCNSQKYVKIKMKLNLSVSVQKR